MKKNLKLLLILFLAVCTVISLVACNPSTDENGDKSSATYTVNFYVEGNVYATKTANDIASLDLPDNPTKEGYSFLGWYLDEAGSPLFSKSSYTPTDTTVNLYAKFAEQSGGTDVDVSENSQILIDKFGTNFNISSIINFCGGGSGIVGMAANVSEEVFEEYCRILTESFENTGTYFTADGYRTFEARVKNEWELELVYCNNWTLIDSSSPFLFGFSEDRGNLVILYAEELNEDIDSLESDDNFYYIPSLDKQSYGVLSKNAMNDKVDAVPVPESAASSAAYALADSGSGILTVPSEFNGKPVTFVTCYGFNGCDIYTSIVLPETIVSIGYCAFCDCSNLASITLPNSVTNLGAFSFSGCESLKEVNVGANLEDFLCIIEDGIKVNFAQGSNCFQIIDNVVYSKDRTKLVYYSPAKTETSFVIPDNVVKIGIGAFAASSALTSVIISDNVTSIGYSAFYGCTGLTSVAIGSGVTSIDSSVFYGCSGLTSISVDENNTVYNSEGNCLIEISSSTMILGCKNSIIPTDGSVTSIGYRAFYRCSGLTSVTIPESVTSIGYNAFYGCSGLTEMTLPFIGSSANATTAKNSTLFGYIFGTSSYTGGIATKQYYASYNDGTYYIPSSLRSVTITGGNILYGAFYNCTGLTSVTIGTGVTSIGSNAFSGCTGLTSVTIGSGVTSIGSNAFSGCTGLTSVTIGSGVTSIGSNAFSGCTGLTSVTIGSGVTSIDSYAFSDCTGLTSITIPDSVTGIGFLAFEGCSKLTSVTIGSGVTSIGNCAFENCYRLVEIYNYSSLPITAGDASFGHIFYAKDVYTSSESESKLSTDNNNFIIYTNGDEKMLIAYIGKETDLIIPDSVTSIGSYAFYGCSGLTSVIIPDSVTSIDSCAFSVCSGLTSVTIPNSVTSIGNSAFSGCSGLTSITIPDGVTSIGNSAFSGCSGLTSITIPDGVTSIGNSAFSGCSGLTSITIPDGVTSIGNSAFSGCSGLTSLMIGSCVTRIGDYAFSYCSGLTSISVDENNTVYNSEGNCLIEISSSTMILGCKNSIIPTDGSVTSISNSAFSGCTGLTSIIIPDSVTNIGHRSFYNCTELISITITGSMKSIGDYAFYGCTGLMSVTIGSGVTSIGESAFGGCSGLTSVTIPDSVTSIGESAFEGCSGLTSISVDENNTVYNSEGNCLIEISSSTMILGCKNSIIPTDGSVTSIGYRAFYRCSGLTSVTIPESVTSIRDCAFEGCTGLTSIIIPDSVTSIGESAFEGCTNIISVTFNTTTGWYVTQDSSDASGISITVTDTSINATNFTSTYYSYYWKRNE